MVSPDSSISPGQRAEKERCQSHFLRIMDVGLATSGLFLASPLLVVLCIAGFFDTGSPLFLQTRVGRQQKPFVLVKFRTMKLETMSVATHLAEPEAITPFGNFLRRSKLDELPQLWNVVLGEMSMVGPRPCLFSHEEWDIRSMLRSGSSNEAVARAIVDMAWTKQAGHGIGQTDFVQPERTMSAIGG